MFPNLINNITVNEEKRVMDKRLGDYEDEFLKSL